MSIDVCVELGAKRAFACALDWPGWCRSGKDEEQALGALAAYASRYAAVAVEGGYPIPGAREMTELTFAVVDHLAGTATTDFGAPDGIAEQDRLWLTNEAVGRLAALVAASWQILDRVVATAPAELRKGPRGGGRDRDKIVEHVLAAETAYARKIGVRQPPPKLGDRAEIDRLREAILAALREQAPDAPSNGWPATYAARRIAWHALDHAWEIEDRSI